MYRLWNLDEIALCVTDHDERIVPDLSERKASGRLALLQQMDPTVDQDQIMVDSRVFVDTLYNTVRTGDKSIAADSTLAANATSQFTPIVRWRRSETASTVAGTTGSRYANGCQIIVKRG